MHTPKVTRPGPLAFGLSPSMLSFSVGSDLKEESFTIKINVSNDRSQVKINSSEAYHRRSIRIIDPASIVIGLSSFSICSTE
jgi:hypothetical protein